MKFILLALFIGVFGVMVILSLLRGITSFLFGKPAPSGSRTNRQKQDSENYGNQSESKKVFDKHEGEYVTYEEIEE